MKIGIVGAGHVGGTVGRLLHRAGHEVCFATRHPDQVQPLVEELGERASAGTSEQAARFGEVILISVPLRAIPEVARAIAPLAVNKVVLETTNPYVQRDGEAAQAAERHPAGSSGWVGSHFPGARVVKAFNSVNYKTLQAEANRGEDRIGIPVAGDDPEAVATAERLVRDAGFTPVAIGGLAEGKRVQPGSPVYNTGMRASELARALGTAR
jgi:8-hydroxy-5-deazaflavin:NADPH oxidoreductase